MTAASGETERYSRLELGTEDKAANATERDYAKALQQVDNVGSGLSKVFPDMLNVSADYGILYFC